LLQSQGPEVALRGAAVRERLLARARAAAAAPTPRPSSQPPPSSEPPPPEGWREEQVLADAAAEELGAEARSSERPSSELPLSSPGFDTLGEPSDDLDLIAAPEPRRAPRPAPGTPMVSASTALLLGTGLGMVSLAALFALLVLLSPRSALDPTQRLAPAPAAPLAESAGTSEQAVADLPAAGEDEEGTGEDIEAKGERAPPPAVVAPSPRATPGAVPRVQHEPRLPLPAPWRIADTGNDAELRRLRGTVGAGPVLTAVQRSGVSRVEAYRLYNSFRGVKNLNRSRPQDSFETLLDSKGHVLAFEYTTVDDEVFQARESNEGKLEAKPLELKVVRQRAQGVIVLHGSFDASAQRAGFEHGLAEVVNKALAGYATTSEMREGDVLSMVVQEVTVLGRFNRYAGIEALEYKKRGAQPVRIYYHSVGRTRAYVDGRGRTFGKSRWARPVAGAYVSSRFNPRRFHPVLKRIKPHNGTDFGAMPGTPILAAASGSVSFVGVAGPNGKMVRLSHSGGYETGYSHMSRFAKGLRGGATVEQKQVIGYVGSTGRSTGPHLHFSAKRGGRFIDPESLNLDGMTRIPPPDRQTFTVLRERYDQALDALALPPDHSPPAAEAVAAAADGATATAAGAAAPAPHDSEAPHDDPAPQDDSEE
jgi:murein DD-endopeptidase MepM/ murein hydrolase activator NlpD